jgi:CubicO group peptidase (beta-lactamase class C family)
MRNIIPAVCSHLFTNDGSTPGAGHFPDCTDHTFYLILVLCHTSGFPNWRFLNADKKPDLKFTPGTQYLYSGEGFEYLARVVAHLKNIPKNDLQHLFENEVAEPSGMKYAFYTWSNYVAKHQATGHIDGKPATGWGINANRPDFAASYSLQTEAISYSNFIIALMNGKGLRKVTYDEMLKAQVRIPSSTDSSSYCFGIKMMPTKFGNVYMHDGYNQNFIPRIQTERHSCRPISFQFHYFTIPFSIYST